MLLRNESADAQKGRKWHYSIDCCSYAYRVIIEADTGDTGTVRYSKYGSSTNTSTSIYSVEVGLDIGQVYGTGIVATINDGIPDSAVQILSVYSVRIFNLRSKLRQNEKELVENQLCAAETSCSSIGHRK